jgi:hypothetical protein
MDVKSRLKHLDRGQVVEAVHLLTRHLFEARSKDALKRIIELDSQGDQEVETAVLSMAGDIERAEGTSIEHLDDTARNKYLHALDGVFWRKVEKDLPSDHDVDLALAKLRAVS